MLPLTHFFMEILLTYFKSKLNNIKPLLPLFLVNVEVCDEITVDSSELSSRLIHLKLSTLYHFCDTESGSKSARLT